MFNKRKKEKTLEKRWDFLQKEVGSYRNNKDFAAVSRSESQYCTVSLSSTDIPNSIGITRNPNYVTLYFFYNDLPLKEEQFIVSTSMQGTIGTYATDKICTIRVNASPYKTIEERIFKCMQFINNTRMSMHVESVYRSVVILSEDLGLNIENTGSHFNKVMGIKREFENYMNPMSGFSVKELTIELERRGKLVSDWDEIETLIGGC